MCGGFFKIIIRKTTLLHALRSRSLKSLTTKKDTICPNTWQLAILFISGVFPWRFYLQEVATLHPQQHPSFSLLLTQVTAFIMGDISRWEGISRAAHVQTDFTALPLFLGPGVLQNELCLMWFFCSPLTKCSSESIHSGEIEDICNVCCYLAVTDISDLLPWSLPFLSVCWELAG